MLYFCLLCLSLIKITCSDVVHDDLCFHRRLKVKNVVILRFSFSFYFLIFLFTHREMLIHHEEKLKKLTFSLQIDLTRIS